MLHTNNSLQQIPPVGKFVIILRLCCCIVAGWLYDKATDTPTNPHVPLEEFKVKKGGFYRFRVIGAAMTYFFRLSIDGHPLYVIASDGYEIKPKKVDYLIITGGERYDFYIDARDPIGSGLYWIRVETLEDYDFLMRVKVLRKLWSTELIHCFIIIISTCFVL